MVKEKIIDYFRIDGVWYWKYEEKQTANEIRKNLKRFRKTNRPSYMFINALLQIQQYQNCLESYVKAQNRLEKEIDEEKQRTVLYRAMLIIWLIVFGIWFWRICCFLFDLFI